MPTIRPTDSSVGPAYPHRTSQWRAASVIAARNKWDKYRFLLKGSQQQLVPFVLEVQGRWGHCARQPFKRLFAQIPIAANRVLSRNFWAYRITLVHARCVASNIVHRFHTMKRHVFGPLAPQHLYFFEPFFGQIIDPIGDTIVLSLYITLITVFTR